VVGRRRHKRRQCLLQVYWHPLLLTAPPPLTSTAFHAFSVVPLRRWAVRRLGGNGGRGGVLALLQDVQD